MIKPADRVVGVGRITGLYGVKGWLKVFSYTDPRENIVEFEVWLLSDGRPGTAASSARYRVEAGRRQGKQVVAKLEGVDDRDRAAELVGAEIGVLRNDLPDPAPGQYYWTDLEGLTVRNRQGETLGTVERLMETGAHDVIVLAGKDKRLIPFVLGKVVDEVNIEDGYIAVDWQSDY